MPTFTHVELRIAAESAEMVSLWRAGQKVGSPVDPIAELHRLDCWPAQITASADAVAAGGNALDQESMKFEKTRRRLLSKWRGDAADAFARVSATLLKDYLSRQHKTKEIGTAGRKIALALDELARAMATKCRQIAAEVEPYSQLVLAGKDDDDIEEAKAMVLAAIRDIRIQANLKVKEIPLIGTLLRRAV
jgi:hypothetical protein